MIEISIDGANITETTEKETSYIYLNFTKRNEELRLAVDFLTTPLKKEKKK